MTLGRRGFLKSAAVLAAPRMLSYGFGTACTDDSTLLNLGLKKQLFFNNLLIESVQDITREFHQPHKYEGNPLIVRDKPWEHVLYFRTSTYNILRDPKDNLFKCWYTDEGFTNDFLQHFEGFSTGPIYRSLYAYSEDGIHWKKPALKFYREDGQDTNIFWGDQQTGGAGSRAMILDPLESDDSKRFKTIYYQASPKNYEEGRIEAAYSADGLHWQKYAELPSFGKFGPHLNDVTLLSYDPDRRVYVLHTRHPRMGRAALNPRFPRTKSFFPPFYPRDFARMNKRRIYESESGDFIHWSEPALIIAPDEEDNLDEALYGMAQYQAGDTYVGLLDVLHEVPDVMNVQLAYSLDGRCWNRVRKPWLTAGAAGTWDQNMVEIATDPLVMGDELWFYYGGSGFGHHDWYTSRHSEGLDVAEGQDVSTLGFFLGLAKLRLDGFCSLNAGPVREGILITRPLASPGNAVAMNAECGSGGYIDVEIFDQADAALPGCSRKEFDRFTGDAIRHRLSWQSKAQIPVQNFRRLIFYMRNANLYSLQFAE